MWFNSMIREEPHQDLYIAAESEKSDSLRGCYTDAAWLPSARVVRCTVKSGNERNPYPVFYMSQETARFKWEEGGDDVKSAWFLRLGLHTCYNGKYRGTPNREVEQILQNFPQFGLESAIRLHEVGIASNRESECHGEYVLGSCTHRPSHQGSR